MTRLEQMLRAGRDYGDRDVPCQAHPWKQQLSHWALFAYYATCGALPLTLRSPATCRRRSPSLMYSILHLVNTLITIFIWLLIAQAVLSWLLAFGVVNRYNRVVASANDFLWRITEPALRPI